MSLKIAVFGQAPFGRDVTARLAEAGHEIVGVHVPPSGGGRPDPLVQQAEESGWPLFRYKGYRRKGEAIVERVEEYLALGAELNVLPFTTVILPPEIIDAPVHKSVCFHPSVLPAYRGGSALAWQIIEGAPETGISVFQPDEGVDTGPLYIQKRGVSIAETDNTASLYFDKLYSMGVEAMVEVVEAIDSGTATLTPQSEEGASFQGLVGEDVAKLDLSAGIEAIDRRIRGCDPQPGAWLHLGEEQVRLYGCRIESTSSSPPASTSTSALGVPGEVLAIEESGMLLAVTGGVLRIQKVRRASRKSTAIESGLAVGDRLV